MSNGLLLLVFLVVTLIAMMLFGFALYRQIEKDKK